MSAVRQSHGLIQIASFFVADEEFGVNILDLQEIIRPQTITKVPRAPAFVEGVINLRGVVIPIINLRSRFGMPVREYDSNTRFVNITMNGIIVGFIVDRVGKVWQVNANQLREAPSIIMSVDAEYVAGIIQTEENMLLVLQADKLLTAEDLAELVRL